MVIKAKKKGPANFQAAETEMPCQDQKASQEEKPEKLREDFDRFDGKPHKGFCESPASAGLFFDRKLNMKTSSASPVDGRFQYEPGFALRYFSGRRDLQFLPVLQIAFSFEGLCHSLLLICRKHNGDSGRETIMEASRRQAEFCTRVQNCLRLRSGIELEAGL